MEWIKEPWPWYVGGPLIALIMGLLLYFNKVFGISSTMRSICSISGAGTLSEFFRYNWKAHVWNLVFAVGAIIGGFLATTFMMKDRAVVLNEKTVASLKKAGLTNIGDDYLPDIFNFTNLATTQGVIFMVIGGFMVGFGTRYAGGCTSGHAISGLSNLQLPSLIAVIGFFIGGLFVTHLIIPHIL